MEERKTFYIIGEGLAAQVSCVPNAMEQCLLKKTSI